MSNYDGSIRINTQLNTSEYQKGLKSIATSTQSAFKKIGGLVAGALSIAALVKFGKECTELASDLAEVDNVVQKSFGNMRGEMDALADSAIKNLGMSRLTAYQTGSTFMSMGKSMLDSAEDAKNMALELTKLTGNMSSFFNVSQDLASIALKSIYTGETETLKQYGVVMTEVNLKQFAMAQGITKAYSEMTQSEKVMLRYQYVMNQLNYIGDDFIDTQDSWANQTRILKEQWKEFMTIIGNGLVTVLTPVVRTLNSIVAVLINVGNTISNILTNVFGLKLQKMTGVAEATAGAYEDMADSASEYGDAAAEAGKKAKSSTSSIDELNNISSQNSKGGSGGAGGIDMSELEAATEPENSVLDTMSEKMSGIVSKIKELVDYTKTWASELNLEPITSAFEKLGNAISPLITLIGSGLEWAYKNVLLPLAKWTIEDAGPAVLKVFAGAIEVVTSVIEALSPLGQWLWEKFLEPIAGWTGGVIVTVLEGIATVLSAIGQWIRDHQELVQNLVIIVGSFAAAIGLVSGAITIISGIITGVGTVITVAKTALVGLQIAFTAITSPIGILTVVIGALIAVGVLLYKNWDTIKEKLEKFKEAMVTIWNAIKVSTSETITNIKNKIANTVSNIVTSWKEKWNSIKTTATTIWTEIKSGITEKVNAIKIGITTFLSNIKTAWSNAWTSVKTGTISVFNSIWNAIKGVINSIIGGIESMANGVVKGINKIIGVLNGFSFDIPDWVPELGGKKLGFDIQTMSEIKIPRLANGGITTGSTLANIGEAGREAILPLENNTGWMDDLADKLGSRINSNVTFQVEGDPNGMFNVMRQQDSMYFKRTGRPAFNV